MNKLLYYTALLLIIFGLFGCKKQKNQQQTPPKTIAQKNNTSAKNSDSVQVFYLVPSPDDIFGFATDTNLYFDAQLLNPISNLDKYNSTKLQEFNFGVYSADLAYTAAFGRKEKTKEYLNAVKSLSEKIGISSVFNESLVQRINNISTNKDSLMALSNDTYFDIIRFLERTNRINTLAIMAAGGWLETMYLVVNLTDFSNKPIVQQIADQKIVFSNLYKFLQQNLNDPNVKSIYEDFKPLNDLYNSLKIEKIKSKSKMQINDDKIIVGGNIRIIITQKQFSTLKNVINKIRNNLTLNNNSL